MYHVLVPVDGNEERAGAQLTALTRLAEEVGDLRAELLFVYEEVDTPADEAGPAYIDAVNRNIESFQDLPATVDTLADGLADIGAKVNVNEVRGKPAVAIVEIADEFGVDAIVLGTRRRTPVGKVLFGSVAQSVILDSDRPVLVATA